MDDREAHDFYADPAHLQPAGPSRKRQAGGPPRLASMTSVRFAPEVIGAVKDRAFGEGITVGSWIRRLVAREIAERRFCDLDTGSGTVRVPADAFERVAAALMPALLEHGTVALRFGSPSWRQSGSGVVSSLPVSVERPLGIIEDSGQAGTPRRVPSSRWTPRTFICAHLSIGGVVSAECRICGPIRAAA